MKNITIILLFLTILLSSCEETILLDLAQTQPRVVIEGQVTNRPGYQYVKVTRSTDFYATGQTPRITNAIVRVVDGNGNVIDFIHNPRGHADSVGFYKPSVPFVGSIGQTYSLSVTVDGQLYEATDTMNGLPIIERLDFQINRFQFNNPDEPGRYYEVLIWVNEPVETKDYYLFKPYRNGVFELNNNTDVYYADDELIGERIEGLSLPLFYSSGDVATIEVYSLSRNAFIFYRDLEKLLNNDGGLFGSPPADPRSNLSNGALGLFQVSAVVSDSITIE